jgi:hypothetical protein
MTTRRNMPIGQIIAGAAIQAGSLMIQAGMKRVIPEIAKLLDDPEIESVVKDVKLDKLITKTCVDISKGKIPKPT